jgi:hypothetical protein
MSQATFKVLLCFGLGGGELLVRFGQRMDDREGDESLLLPLFAERDYTEWVSLNQVQPKRS